MATIPHILDSLGRPNALRDRQAPRAFVCDLRRKLESDSRRPDVLLDVARVGYRLFVEPDGPASLVANEKGHQETAAVRGDVREP